MEARHLSKRIRIVIAYGALAIFIVTISSALTRAGNSDARVEGPQLDASRLLAQAREAAPFDLMFPASIPAGLTLNNVIWSGADPDEFPESKDFTTDIWFIDSSGERPHIWQTNSTSLSGADPTVRSAAVSELIGGVPWMVETIDFGTYSVVQVSRRFPDGILVSVDAADGVVARAIAAALE
jgi:hypothetical protein